MQTKHCGCLNTNTAHSIDFLFILLQFEGVLAAYFADVDDSKAVRRKYEAVRMRGRKRLAFG